MYPYQYEKRLLFLLFGCHLLGETPHEQWLLPPLTDATLDF